MLFRKKKKVPHPLEILGKHSKFDQTHEVVLPKREDPYEQSEDYIQQIIEGPLKIVAHIGPLFKPVVIELHHATFLRYGRYFIPTPIDENYPADFVIDFGDPDLPHHVSVLNNQLLVLGEQFNAKGDPAFALAWGTNIALPLVLRTIYLEKHGLLPEVFDHYLAMLTDPAVNTTTEFGITLLLSLNHILDTLYLESFEKVQPVPKDKVFLTAYQYPTRIFQCLYSVEERPQFKKYNTLLSINRAASSVSMTLEYYHLVRRVASFGNSFYTPLDAVAKDLNFMLNRTAAKQKFLIHFVLSTGKLALHTTMPSFALSGGDPVPIIPIYDTKVDDGIVARLPLNTNLTKEIHTYVVRDKWTKQREGVYQLCQLKEKTG